MFKHSLVVLRRDLRIHDHTAILQACRQSEKVSLCFVLDPKQLSKHKWQSMPALAFMQQSLIDLHQELGSLGSGLQVFSGDPSLVIHQVVESHSVDAVFINRDYTPFARARDKAIHEALNEKQVPSFWCDDALLNPPEAIRNGSGLPYKVFTAFFKACSKLPVATPQALDFCNFATPMSTQSWQENLQTLSAIQHAHTTPNVGRSMALGLLDMLQDLPKYAEQRDFPALDATSHLSAHLKFGTVSVREVYQAIFQYLGQDHPLLRQLYWRDFFTHIAFNTPHVFGQAFDKRFSNIIWENDKAKFDAWCQGNTGFLIVDAGMRELLETSNMHNRVRMITASFLVKDLHIDWRWGEAWFARHLTDYDPALNNGNWQWSASTGCDAQPWFRIFNPWRQQERFDAEGHYIRQWLPHLAEVSAQDLLHWYKRGDASLHPLPIVEHKAAAAHAKSMYQYAIQVSQELT
ncbi:MAG: deoxyribodipyrimidine photo-lyase [Ghiorsea sp.]